MSGQLGLRGIRGPEDRAIVRPARKGRVGPGKLK